MPHWSFCIAVAVALLGFGARADTAWHPSPFLEFGELPGTQDRAISLQFGGGQTDSEPGAEKATDADYQLKAIAAALMFQRGDRERLVLRLGWRQTDVDYDSIPQDRDIESFGAGLDYYYRTGDTVVNLGFGMSAVQFDNKFGSENRDSWNGQTFELHATLSGLITEQPFGRFNYFLGAQFLSLQQKAHDLQSVSLNRETRDSRTLMAGVEYRGNGQRLGLPASPWTFAGVVHEFNDRPPQRPTLLAAGPGLSNSFTLFSDQLNKVPDKYPDPTTLVFGVGLNGSAPNGSVYNVGVYYELNDDYTAAYLRVGISFSL